MLNHGKKLMEDKGLIFIVDDEQVNVNMLTLMLNRHGSYENFSTTDPLEAVALVEQRRPDMVLLDINMPEKSGLEILEEIRALDGSISRIPIIILTASHDNNLKLRALDLGASDFVEKPFKLAELLTRIQNSLRIKWFEDELERQNSDLERKVFERTSMLNRSRLEVIKRLSKTAEYRDDDTGRHVLRVGIFAAIVARTMKLDPGFTENLFYAAPMHDMGKVGIPDSILLKPGKLTPEEWTVMKTHTEIGGRIFEPVDNIRWVGAADELVSNDFEGDGGTNLMKFCRNIALTHHERYNGKGYPRGLSGNDIPIEGQITSIADVFDALASDRPYKKAFPLEKCLAILKEEREEQFHPDVVDAFFDSLDLIVEMKNKYKE